MDYATCLTGTRLLIHSLFDEGNYGGRTNQGWTKNLSAIANGTEGAWSWPVMYTKNRHDAKRFDFQHTVAWELYRCWVVKMELNGGRS